MIYHYQNNKQSCNNSSLRESRELLENNETGIVSDTQSAVVGIYTNTDTGSKASTKE